MTRSLDNKVVAITGASSGIGEAAARLLARSGARVVLGARRIDRLERIAGETREAGGAAIARALDVSSVRSVRAFVTAAVCEFGSLDVLVNNAGVMLVSPLDALDIDGWNQMIDVNLRGVLNGIAAALPVMREQASGHIINVSSVAGHKVAPGFAAYCATKFAVGALSEGLRQEAGEHIRCTVISPGAVATELPNHVADGAIKEAVDAMYKAASIEPEAIAEAIHYAIAQPAGVDINEILIRPVAQTF